MQFTLGQKRQGAGTPASEIAALADEGGHDSVGVGQCPQGRFNSHAAVDFGPEGFGKRGEERLHFNTNTMEYDAARKTKPTKIKNAPMPADVRSRVLTESLSWTTACTTRWASSAMAFCPSRADCAANVPAWPLMPMASSFQKPARTNIRPNRNSATAKMERKDSGEISMMSLLVCGSAVNSHGAIVQDACRKANDERPLRARSDDRCVSFYGGQRENWKSSSSS